MAEDVLAAKTAGKVLLKQMDKLERLLQARRARKERKRCLDMRSMRKDNPYRRLLALEERALTVDVTLLRAARVAIVGVGSVGASAAEALARCGVGKLIVIDRACVTKSSLSGLYWQPALLGWPKTRALARQLLPVNPDVTVEQHELDVAKAGNAAMLRKLLGGVELVISATDRIAARLALSETCLQLDVPLLDAKRVGGLGGAVQLLLPGQSACVLCTEGDADARRSREEDDEDAKEQESEGSDAKKPITRSRLPASDAVLAGLLAHAALRYLLHMGRLPQSSSFTASHALLMRSLVLLEPNVHCPACRDMQARVASERRRKMR
eukprot:PLAT14996.1.p1 GENE.PLAT14996.1~~PLAT14996.1.p1  ORF type:complete len:325 (-),score=61.29 PLAT14996.1:110-1084(-)